MTERLQDIEIDAELASRLRDAQQAYDEVAEYLQSLKDEVKSRFHEFERARGVCEGEEIFTCVRRRRRTVQSRRLKRDYPEIWHAYSTDATTTYVTIARVKGGS